MITKEISIEGIEQNRYEVRTILADNSLRGELFSVDDWGNDVGERLHNAVFVEPWPFELTAQDLETLNTEPTTHQTL